MTEELKQLREALRRVKHEAASLADAQVIALEALTQRPAAQAGEREAPYGYCPECGAPGVMRERRPDGDDKCSNGHRYPSRSAHTSLPTQPAAQEMPDAVEHYGTVDDLPAAQATPEPVGEVVATVRTIRGVTIGYLETRLPDGTPLYTHTAPGVPEEALAVAEHIRAKAATPEPVGEVFGYFRALPFGWEQCGEHDDGAVALYDRPAPGVPEGFALVPVEPTLEMLKAMESQWLVGSQVDMANREYAAMLAAAQAKGADK